MSKTKPFIVHELDCEIEDWSKQGRSGVSWQTLISADRTPTNSITMGIAEIQPSSDNKLHLHRHKPAEAYYVLSGSGFVSIDGVNKGIEPGSAIFVPSGALHAVGNNGSEVLRILYAFGVDSFEDVVYEFPSFNQS